MKIFSNDVDVMFFLLPPPLRIAGKAFFSSIDRQHPRRQKNERASNTGTCLACHDEQKHPHRSRKSPVLSLTTTLLLLLLFFFQINFFSPTLTLHIDETTTTLAGYSMTRTVHDQHPSKQTVEKISSVFACFIELVFFFF